MKNMIEKLAGYRVKVEREGREVVNIPGILALPGLLAAPKASIIGMIAAPLLGCNIRVENENGKEVDVGKKVQEAAETIADTAKKTARTIRKEVDKAWESVSAEDDDPESAEEEAETAEDIPEDPEQTDDTPTIEVKPDDSKQA